MKRLLTLALGVCAHVLAQNAALMPMPRLTFLDSNGVPLSGGYLYTCVAGTSCTPALPGRPAVNPLATYTDASATVANANPIVLDAAGRANVWLGKNLYKIVVQDANGVTQYSQDNVNAPALAVTGSLAGANGAGLVIYTAAGTGAVSRTVAAKFDDVRSVKDFGAKMDGSTDDSAALQACVNATGNTCLVPVGTLKFGTTLTLPVLNFGAAHLSCVSHNSVLKFTGTGDALAALGSSAGATSTGLTVENCTVNLASAGAGSNGIHVRAFSGGLLSNVQIVSAPNDGFLNEGANSMTVTDLIVYGSGVNGIHERGLNLSGVGYSANGNHYLGGIVANSGKWGIFEDAGPVGGVVTANQNETFEMIFETNGTNGTASGQVYLQGCDSCTLRNSYLEANAGNVGPLYNVVIGGSATDGIGNVLYRPYKVVIDKNFMGTPGSAASVKIVQAIGATITDNWEAGTPTYFLDIGNSGLVSGTYSFRNAATSAINGYLTGTDASLTLATDGVGNLVNSQSPTIFGAGFLSIASSVANQEVRFRGNGGSLIAAFQNTGGSTVASVDNTGKLTFAGFSGIPQDSPGFKYKTQSSCTTAAVQYATCNTAVTWTTAFADIGYVTICSPAGNVNGVVSVVDQPSRTTSSVTVTIANTGNNAAASSTTLACAAWHQ